MKKLVIGVFVLGAAVIAGLFVYIFYSGPRMKVQAHIRAYQMSLPGPPPGTVMVTPPAQPAAAIPRTAAAQAWGKVYYQYYCIFCHGENGAGNGPVGQSYIPVPTDLRSQRVVGMSDPQLLRAIVTGVGHEPVLEQNVPPAHRPYIVSYVRSLSGR